MEQYALVGVIQNNMPGSEKQNSMFKKTKGYVQEGNPFAVTSCGRRRNDGEPIFEMDSPL